MAINIPIISSLNAAGFDKAKKEFQSLGWQIRATL